MNVFIHFFLNFSAIILVIILAFILGYIWGKRIVVSKTETVERYYLAQSNGVNA